MRDLILQLSKSSIYSTKPLCSNGVNCHLHRRHFVPAIRQCVECERIDTWLAGTKCTRDFR
ncbi:hypothetical protein CI711_10445 [Shigella boydii]|nr:hypothetical protein CI711_10445 [Shigella boydii]